MQSRFAPYRTREGVRGGVVAFAFLCFFGTVFIFIDPPEVSGEVLCRSKYTHKLRARKVKCKPGEFRVQPRVGKKTLVFSGASPDITTVNDEDLTVVPGGRGKVGIGTNTPEAYLDVFTSSLDLTAERSTGAGVTVVDGDAVVSGEDFTTALDLSIIHQGAVGGTIRSTGLNVSVLGDTGGDSTSTGIHVSVAGADRNYAAIFEGGGVGIGVREPEELLDVAGRIRLEETSPPADPSGRLYNVGGDLFWNGVNLSGGSEDGSISAVTAGTGLLGGGSSGAITLSVDVGTTANKIVQLDGSGALPAVSGANLTHLDASALLSGTVPDSRLSGNVSLLGSSIDLGSEVSGVLGVGSGGTGSTTLNDLIVLGTHTTGNYVATVSGSSQVSVSGSGSESAAVTIGIANDSIGPTQVDETLNYSWSGTHGFSNTVTASGNVVLGDGLTDTVTVGGTLQSDLVFEGATADSFETTLQIADPTADRVIVLPNASGTLALVGDSGAGYLLDTGDTGSGAYTFLGTMDLSGTVLQGGAPLVFEGSTGDAFETTLAVTDPTADRTITLPNASGEVSLLGQSIDLGSEVSGVLGVGSGGTGSTTLNDLITLGTHTTGNYVASLTEGTAIDVGAAGEGATPTVAWDSTEVGSTTFGSGSALTWTFDASAGTDPAISFGNGSVALSDGNLLDLSAIDVSSSSEGLALPQSTNCTNATAEGRVCWDTDDNTLYIGNGASPTAISVAADSIDFTHIVDAMTLDANLSISQGASTWTQSFTGTTTDALTLNATSLTTGSALVINGPSGATAGVTDAVVKVGSDVGNSTTSSGLISSTAIVDTTAAGANGVNLHLATTNSNSSNSNTIYGMYNSVTDAVSLGNTVYGSYTNVNVTGNVNALKETCGVCAMVSNDNITTDQGSRWTFGGKFIASGSTRGANWTYGIVGDAYGGDLNHGVVALFPQSLNLDGISTYGFVNSAQLTYTSPLTSGRYFGAALTPTLASGVSSSGTDSFELVGAYLGPTFYSGTSSAPRTLSEIHGLYSAPQVFDYGTVTNVYALYANPLLQGGYYFMGNVTNVYGLFATATTTGGTVTNKYGVYVDATSGGTNNYGVAIEAMDTQTLWIAANDSAATTPAKGIAFGSARDVNLYRGGANILRTDDSLSVGGDLIFNDVNLRDDPSSANALSLVSGDSLTVLNGAICVDNDGNCTSLTAGQVRADSFPTTGGDVAEMYPSVEPLEPGDLVVVADSDKVGKSRSRYAATLMGIVSTDPGVILRSGEFYDDDSRSTMEQTYPIALAGRVPVKVSLENGPIRLGDYLTSSSVPGVAMRATEAGPTVGIALEPFDGSEGETGKIVGFAMLGERNTRTLAKEFRAEVARLKQENRELKAGQRELSETVEQLWHEIEVLRTLFKTLSEQFGASGAKGR